jgi:flagellin-specific chaperone FliS
MTEQLFKANAENSVEIIRGVEKVMTNLLEGWRGAVSQVESGGGKPK